MESSSVQIPVSWRQVTCLYPQRGRQANELHTQRGLACVLDDKDTGGTPCFVTRGAASLRTQGNKAPQQLQPSHDLATDVGCNTSDDIDVRDITGNASGVGSGRVQRENSDLHSDRFAYHVLHGLFDFPVFDLSELPFQQPETIVLEQNTSGNQSDVESRLGDADLQIEDITTPERTEQELLQKECSAREVEVGSLQSPMDVLSSEVRQLRAEIRKLRTELISVLSEKASSARTSLEGEEKSNRRGISGETSAGERGKSTHKPCNGFYRALKGHLYKIVTVAARGVLLDTLCQVVLSTVTGIGHVARTKK
eukprot:IDg23921t1